MSRKDNKGRVLFKGETQHKDGRYAYSYTDQLGKRHSIYDKDLVKLRLKEKEIHRRMDDGLDPAKADRITVNQMFDRYISLKYDIKPSTRENYIYMYEKYIRESFGKKKLSKVRYSDVKAFYYSLINERGFKPASMEIAHTLLHPTFNMAVRDGYINRNPTDGVMGEIKKSHQWEHKKRHALTIEQQRAVSTFLDTHEDYRGWRPIITVLLGTGMRIGECLGLRWEDIDFKANEIDVNHNLIYRKNLDGKCENHVNSPKTESGKRRIPILEGVKDALLEELELQRCIGFCKDEIDGYSGFIFSTCENHVYTPESVNRAIKRIYTAYNEEETFIAKKEHRDPILLPHFSAHVLRHTFCTRLCENETNLRVIMDIMGHSDIQTTMNIYAEVTGVKKQESMMALSDKILV